METLGQACAGLGFPLPEKELLCLKSYLELVLKWNRVMNLVGPYSWRQILAILIIDSFHLAAFLQNVPLPEQPECWDLGAGAGLPGIPLRMLWQPGSYTLVESREKRALFLQNCLSVCSLPGVAVFRGRAEQFMPTRPAADLVVSRAFMPWENVLELVSPFVNADGVAVFLTLAPLPRALPGGWRAESGADYSVGADTRHLWALRKAPQL